MLGPASPPLHRLLVDARSPDTDYAFELATAAIRYGEGVTQEIGDDAQLLRAEHVAVFTDANLLRLPPVHTVLESLSRRGLKYTVFSQVRVEPNDASLRTAIEFASMRSPHVRYASTTPFDLFVAVGGGSVMDTCKAANLYSSQPPADFLDYVNAPIGKGLPPPGPLKPLIAVPTTAGTGSETTGVAIFDYSPLHAKTGIAHRRLKPTLGLIDPNNTRTLPPSVAAASGFDVLSHALESYTAIPFDRRSPRPSSPLLRPAYQGANPISDVWCMKALELLAQNFVRAVEDPDDSQARAAMLLAATYAGVGFGNAGVHLPHGMSYAVASQVRSYQHPDYPHDHPIVPHGVSVIVNAPAVFRFTSASNAERHRQCARVLGAQQTEVSDGDSGEVLAQRLLYFMHRLHVPDGLRALGYSDDDVESLVAGTIPQERVTRLAPRPSGRDELAALFRRSMRLY